MKLKRMTAALLLLAMLLSCLPLSVLAADAEPVDGTETVDTAPAEDAEVEDAEAKALSAAQSADGENFFYFSAEAEGKLLIAPVKISYQGGQTIWQALNASQYRFEMDGGDGFVTTIENVTGNYRYSSVPSGVTLDHAAASVTYFRFTESEQSAITAGLQMLMQVMAGYLDKPADVRSAASAAYQKAYDNYLCIDSDTAKSYAEELTKAITDYEAGQQTTYEVSFSQFTGADYTISAANSFGKQFYAETDGKLRLPNGNYTFCIRRNNKSVTGELTVNGTALTISGLPSIPTAEWINEEAFAISEVSGYNETKYKPLELTDDGAHAFAATILDTFTGPLYPYVTLTGSVPDGAAISAIYTNTAGAEISSSVTDGSKREPLYGVLTRGANGNEILFRVSAESGSYMLHEELTLRLGRKPTLSALRMEGASGNKPAANERFSNQTFTYTYKVLNTEKSLKIYPTPTVQSYSVYVNGTQLTDAYVSVPVEQTKETQNIPVLVTSGRYRTEYTLIVQRGKGKKVTVTLADGNMDIVMKNGNGEILQSRREAGNKYIYTLVNGEEYTYYATKDTYYHAEETFTLNDENAEFTVSIPQAQIPSLSELYVGLRSSLPIEALDFGQKFTPETHSYTAVVPDNQGRLAVWADPADGAACTLRYCSITDTNTDGTWQTVQDVARTSAEGKELTDAILFGNVYGNTLTFTASKAGTASGTKNITYSADYVVTLKRGLSLNSMTITYGGSPVILHYGENGTGFLSSQKAYIITVPEMATALELTLGTRNGPRYGETDSGYALLVNNESVQAGEAVSVALSGAADTQSITITVKDQANLNDATDYTVTVNKAAGTAVKFSLAPEGAMLYIYEKASGVRLWPDSEGRYAFSTGFTYLYSLTKYGFAGRSGAIQLEAGDNGSMTLHFGTMQQTDKTERFEPEQSYPVADNTVISLQLKTADKNPDIDPNIPSGWADFRGTAYDANGNMTGTANTNNGVTRAKIPFAAESGTLYWASKVGDGYSEGAVGNPILVGGNLIAYAGTRILKIDKDTGAVLREGTMAGTSSFAINNSTYAEGMILVGLSNGRIQAFNADTLESLWLYTDPLGGQPNCPITVSDGYAYTGFWNSEIKNASFVCISLTDEDPGEEKEAKAPTWRYVQKGGFYWAGAYVCRDYVLVGTDDGKSGYTSKTANVLLLDPMSGKLLDSMTGFAGDIRSTICYDKATNAFYFDSKGSYFYRVRVQKDTDGAWKLTDRAELPIGGMSTSTPVVANGRAYIGVSGSGQFTEYSGHSITVIDLSGAMSIAYRADTQGYPQTSGLLTTGYDNYNYIYFLDNYTPGTLRVLRDKEGQTKADYTTIERVGETEQTYTTAYALFTPAGEQAQYCICSPIVDENGTLYFKNDSGYLMAYGSAVEELKVESAPAKTHYEAGDKFDTTGLKVTATYANGVTRDVTKLMKMKDADKALTEKDKSVTLIYGLGQTMYHNSELTDKTMKPGEKTTTKEIPFAITVGSSTSTGKIGESLNWSFSAQSGKLTISGTFPTGAKLIAAVYTTDGKLVGTGILTETGEMALPDGAAIKLFLLNGMTNAPLCQSETVKNP